MDKNFLCEGYAFAPNLDYSGIVLNMMAGPGGTVLPKSHFLAGNSLGIF
jgi:hypothetical protein